SLVAVAGQDLGVVPQPVDLDPVVLDGAPGHRQQVEDQVRAGRHPKPSGSYQAVVEHLQRGQVQAGHGSLDQTGVRPPVVDTGDPLTDHGLQLVDEEVGAALGILATAVDVGAFVAGQCRQQLLAEG